MFKKSFLIGFVVLISGHISAQAMTHDSQDKDDFQQQTKIRLSKKFGVRKSGVMIDQGNSYVYSDKNEKIYDQESIACGIIFGNSDALFAAGRVIELTVTNHLPESFSKQMSEKLQGKELLAAIEFYEQAAHKGSSLACEALFQIYSGRDNFDLEKAEKYQRQYLVSTSKNLPETPTFLEIENAIRTKNKIAALTGMNSSPKKGDSSVTLMSKQNRSPSNHVSVLGQLKKKIFCCFFG
jgi:hypothetical protein